MALPIVINVGEFSFLTVKHTYSELRIPKVRRTWTTCYTLIGNIVPEGSFWADLYTPIRFIICKCPIRAIFSAQVCFKICIRVWGTVLYTNIADVFTKKQRYIRTSLHTPSTYIVSIKRIIACVNTFMRVIICESSRLDWTELYTLM